MVVAVVAVELEVMETAIPLTATSIGLTENACVFHRQKDVFLCVPTLVHFLVHVLVGSDNPYAIR